MGNPYLFYLQTAGFAVSSYSSLTSNPPVIHHAIPLYAAPVTLSVPTLTAVCRERYRSVLAARLRDLARSVNYQVCTGELCPYMSGAPGGGASIGETALGTRELYVAVDASDSALSSALTLDYDASTVTRQFLSGPSSLVACCTCNGQDVETRLQRSWVQVPVPLSRNSLGQVVRTHASLIKRHNFVSVKRR